MAEGAGGREVGRISIRVVPNTDRFRRELKTQLEAIEREVKATIQVDLDLNASGAKAHLRAMLAEMKVMARNSGVDVKVGTDRSQLQELSTDAGNLARRLTKLGDSAGYNGQQFLGLTRMGWLVTAVFAAAAPVVGLVAGLLAGLPSLISAAGIGLGAIALGMDGIKSAAAVVAPQFMALKAAVSSVFSQGLTPVFQQLAPLFPILQSGMSQVAQSLVGMAQGFTNVVTNAAGMKQIETLLSNTANFITALTPTMQSFAQTFLTLSTQGSNAFGLLVAPMQQFAFQFEQMINRVSANGVLTGALQGLSDTMGSFLNLFTKLFESGLKAMGELGGPIANLVDGFGGAINALLPALTSLSGLVGNVAGALGSALAPVITAITPAFTLLANTLGSTLTSALSLLSPILTQVASALNQSLMIALTEFNKILPQILPALQQFSQVLTAELAKSLPQIAEAFGHLIAALLPMTPLLIKFLTSVIPLFTQMTPLITGFIEGVTALVSVFTGLASVLGGVDSAARSTADALGGALKSAFDGVVGAISGALGAVGQFVSGFISGAEQVISTATQIPGKIAAAFANAAGMLVDAGRNLIQGLINGITSMAGAAISAARNVAGQVVGAVKGLLGIHSPSRVFNDIGQYTMQGLQQGLEGGFPAVLARAQDIAQQLADAVRNGVVPPGLKDQLKQELAELGLEYDQLKVQLNQTPDAAGKANVRDQMQQVQALRDQLGLQSDQLGFSQKYGKSLDNNNQLLGSSLNKMVDIGKGFGESTVKQFESDLGVSGSGAVPQLAEQGLGWLTQTLGNLATGALGGGTTIQVNSVDDALAARQNLVNKQALQFVGR